MRSRGNERHFVTRDNKARLPMSDLAFFYAKLKGPVGQGILTLATSSTLHHAEQRFSDGAFFI